MLWLLVLVAPSSRNTSSWPARHDEVVIISVWIMRSVSNNNNNPKMWFILNHNHPHQEACSLRLRQVGDVDRIYEGIRKAFLRSPLAPGLEELFWWGATILPTLLVLSVLVLAVAGTEETLDAALVVNFTCVWMPACGGLVGFCMAFFLGALSQLICLTFACREGSKGTSEKPVKGHTCWLSPKVHVAVVVVWLLVKIC